MATLYITHPLGEKDRVIYDTHATTATWCQVTFEDEAGEPAEWTGPSVNVVLEDGSSLDIYQDVDGQSPLGKYVIDASSWKLFGPDGPARVLSDAGPLEIDGVEWNPKQFQAVTPGRWLVKVQAQLIVQESDTGLGYYVTSDTVSTFTALLEIEDPHIIGNVDGGHLETSSGSIGTSFAAPTEQIEYDSDEGWARSVERYLSTLSKGMAFRKLATGEVTDVAGIQYGELLTVVSAQEYSRWRSSLVGIDLGGTERYYYNYTLQVRKVVPTDLQDEAFLEEMPLFVSLGTAAQNGRVYMMVEGCLPYDTSASGLAGMVLPTLDPVTLRNTRLFVQSTGVLGSDLPSSLDPTHFDRYVGHVVSGNATDDATIPGSIYFHGHASWLPGTVQGPLSSTDNAVVRWDGTSGEKIQNSSLLVDHFSDFPPVTPTESYTDIVSVKVLPEENAGVHATTGTSLHLSTKDGDGATRISGHILVQPGETLPGVTGAADVYVAGGDGDTTGGHVRLISGLGKSASDGTSSGDIHLAVSTGLTGGDIVANAGGATGSSLSDSAGTVSISAGSATHVDGGRVEILGGSTTDLGAAGSLGGDVLITAGEGASGGDVVLNGGQNIGGGGINGDVLISYHTDGSPNGRTGIGGAAPDAGFAPMPTAILKVTGDSYFDGDLHISNKLTVDGIIDPIALILTSHVDDLAGAIPAGEGALFVAKGGGSLDHEGNPLVTGELYYKYEDGFDGIAEKVVSLSAGAGLSIPGPAAGTTYASAIAKWGTDNGAILENSKILVDAAATILLGATFNNVASLSTATPVGSTKTDGGLSWTTSTPLFLTTGESTPGSGEVSGDIVIHPGVSDATTAAGVTINSGETRVAGAGGGRLNLSGGDTGAVVAELFYAGGGASLRGGDNKSGTTSAPNDWERRGLGGTVSVQGGDGNDGGHVQISGGKSFDALTSDYAHGPGGKVEVSGGTAGLDPTGTKASFEPGISDVAVRGGDLILSGGDTYTAPAETTIKGPSGGDVYISGGDAGIGTGAPVNGTVAAPINTVQAANGGGFLSEDVLTPLNEANHQFHGRGGSVVIEAGAGDHTGGSGSITIRTKHSNEGWTAGPETVAGVDPNAGRGSIGDISIVASDSLSRSSTAVPGGNITIQAGKAGSLTAGDSGKLEIKPGEPDWPLSAPIDHDGDPLTPDVQLVEAGPDAQQLLLGVLTDTPWPVDFGILPPTLIGPDPGSVSLDPEGRGVVLVGTDTFDKSAHLVFGATMPAMVVDGDLQVTGNIDPKGLELRPEPQNPARAAITAKGGNPDDAIHADRISNVLWVNSSSGNALMLGDNQVTSVGATVTNPGDAEANTVPVMQADGSVKAVSPTEPGGYLVKTDNVSGDVIGTQTKGARYESFSNSSYDPGSGDLLENRDSSYYPNSRDYIVAVDRDANVICVDMTSALIDEAVSMGWSSFDPDADLSTSDPASLSRYVVELPPVSESVGRKLVIKDAKGYSNKFGKFPMVVVRASRGGSDAEYVDDAASFGSPDPTAPDAALLPEPYSSVTLLCNGERWLII